MKLLENLQSQGILISHEQEELFLSLLKKELSYIPKIGIFGKTGAGKSSLFNAIYGEDLCDVSDVEACTRQLQQQDIGGVILIDCPGIAESKEKDQQYMKMYMNLIPDLDVIFWVLKADDRAYSPDIEFYKVIKSKFADTLRRVPVFFVLNQVDKIEPIREWNVDAHTPSTRQLDNISSKIDYVAMCFEIAPSRIIPVSASERYNLVTLINNMLADLPANTSTIIYEDLKTKEETQSFDETKRISTSEVVQQTANVKSGLFIKDVLKKVGVTVITVIKLPGSIIRSIFGKRTR